MECRLARITVSYESIGNGRPLVVLPGWPDAWQVPADYLEPFFEDRRGWCRIYVDLPGRGSTKGEPWITTNDQVLDIVLEFLERVVGDQRFVLAGHSAGAHLARAILHRRAGDVDGLLQVVPVFEKSEQERPGHVTLARDDALIRRIEIELGPDVAAEFSRFFVVQSPAIYERMKALLPAMRGADRAFLDKLDDTFTFVIDPLPKPFTRPTLFVLGRQDAVVGYRPAFDLIATYPRATLAVLDRAGHGLPWEQVAVFRALVGEWLDRVDHEAGASPDDGGGAR